jgi:hypothetical protein
MSTNKEVKASEKSFDELITEEAWNLYCVSPLYKFKHDDKDVLVNDAMDLTSFLRKQNAGGSLKADQSVTVSVRSRGTVVMFVIHEQMLGGSVSRVGGFIYHRPEKSKKNHQKQPQQLKQQRRHTDILLLQGNEELLAKVCSWIQSRYQCVMLLQAVEIQPGSIERFAQILFICMLKQKRNHFHAGAGNILATNVYTYILWISIRFDRIDVDIYL